MKSLPLRTITNVLLCGVIFASFFLASQRAVLASRRTADDDIAALLPLIEVLSEVLSNDIVGSDHLDEEELVRAGIYGMVGTLDQHSAFLPKQDYKEFRDGTSGSFGGLGIRIQTLNGWLHIVEPLPGTPAARAHLRADDKIVRINGRKTKDMPISEAVTRLKGPPGTSVEISVLRKGWTEPREYTLKRDIIKVPSVEAKLINGHIGYIRLREFQQNSGKDMRSLVEELTRRGMTGFVLDLRFNQGGLLNVAREVSDMLLPRGLAIVKIKEGGSEILEPLSSVSEPLLTCPVVILVNASSASASEIVAGAVQDWNRGVIVGPQNERTYGKGSVQTVIDLEGGNGLKLTTAKYFTPRDRSIHRTDPADPKSGGIEPDVQVPVDPQTYRSINLFKMGELPEHYTVEKILDPNGPEPIPDEDLADPGSDPAPGVHDLFLERACQILDAALVFDRTASVTH